jgi:hypothetical protein
MLEERTAKDNAALCKAYFKQRGDSNVWKCSCGCDRTKLNGWTNLKSHIVGGQHPEWPDVLEALKKNGKGPLDNHFTSKITSKAKNLFGWLEWIVMTDQPKSFVENTYNRKHTKLDPIGRVTFDKYLDLACSAVQDKIAEELPETFGLIFDGWTMDREHYIGIFATWTKSTGAIVKRLLCCGVQDLPDEALGEDAEDFGFTAEDIGDYVLDVLQKYNKSYENIEFISGDNASVNQRLCDLIKVWLRREKDIIRTVCAFNMFIFS